MDGKGKSKVAYVPPLEVHNHERRYKKSQFCVPTVPKTEQKVWISIASVRESDNTRTDAMLKNLSALQRYAIQWIYH